MRTMLSSEYGSSVLESEFVNCCSEHEKCSQDLKKIANAIQQLQLMRPHHYVDRVASMENALQDKCYELKKQRAIVGQLLTQATSQVETCDAGVQHQQSYRN